MRTPESELLERAEWYQAQHQKLLTALSEFGKRNNTFKEALERIRDHDKIILGEHMDQVRAIAREALE